VRWRITVEIASFEAIATGHESIESDSSGNEIFHAEPTKGPSRNVPNIVQ
jgi:hypothetical protein